MVYLLKKQTTITLSATLKEIKYYSYCKKNLCFHALMFCIFRDQNTNLVQWSSLKPLNQDSWVWISWILWFTNTTWAT